MEEFYNGKKIFLRSDVVYSLTPISQLKGTLFLTKESLILEAEKYYKGFSWLSSLLNSIRSTKKIYGFILNFDRIKHIEQIKIRNKEILSLTDHHDEAHHFLLINDRTDSWYAEISKRLN